MKTIGKIAALAMTVSLAFVLTACGGSASSSAAASSASASASSASAAASSTSAASSESAAASSASAAASSTSAADADVYINEAFGIEYKLPDGWKFVDSGSIKEMNSFAASVAAGESVEMIATAPDGSASVIITLAEPTSATTAKTAEDFLKAQTEELQKGLQGSNYSYTSTDAQVTFDGLTRTLPANITSITVEGATLVIGQAVAETEGYFLDVIVVGANENDVMKAFEAFRAAVE